MMELLTGLPLVEACAREVMGWKPEPKGLIPPLAFPCFCLSHGTCSILRKWPGEYEIWRPDTDPTDAWEVQAKAVERVGAEDYGWALRGVVLGVSSGLLTSSEASLLILATPTERCQASWLAVRGGGE